MSKRLHVCCSICLCIFSTASWASGYFINQQSIAGLGRADAGNVAAANDLGTMFFNPAGMTNLWDSGADDPYITSLGAHVIIPQSDLTDIGSTAISPGTLGTPVPVTGSNGKDPSDATPVLNAYIARRLADERTVLGFRLNSPFGLSAEYPSDWFGRYDSTKAELVTADIGFAVAYQLNDDVSIGGGIDVQYADSELAAAIPNPLAPGGPTAATDGRLKIEGDNWNVGFNVGMVFRTGQNVRIGLHYRSGQEHDLSGSATTSGLSPPLDAFNGSVGAAAKLRLPAIFAAGFAWAPETSRWALYGDYTWYEWSEQDVTRIELSDGSPPIERRSNFRDSHTLALGFDFDWTERFTFRGGLKQDKSPTRNGFRDTTFADDDRFWVTVGGTYNMSGSFAVDFAVVHTFVDDTTIDLTQTFFDGTALATAIQTTAGVDSRVNTVSIGIRKSF